MALFFYDQYGGRVIGLLWKPNASLSKFFHVSATLCKCVDVMRILIDARNSLTETYTVIDSVLQCRL